MRKVVGVETHDEDPLTLALLLRFLLRAAASSQHVRRIHQ
jgi:hypothetical protein